jgi:hypothetical protein
VYYEDDYELVPLLSSEVPFPYDSEHLVFLWDRVTGIALATSRQAAWGVLREVPEGPSAVALFGERPEDMGYSHELMTGPGVDCGPYPMVQELRSMGITDHGKNVSFRNVAPGLYECEVGKAGVSMDELDPYDVIGGVSKSKGFGLAGITPTAFTAATNMNVFSRLCVIGAGAVDLDVKPIAENQDGTVSRADLRWFGAREHHGAVLNMGMVTVGGASDLTTYVEVDVEPSVRRLFWLEERDGEWVTRSMDVVQGEATIRVKSKLCGLYVYAVTSEELPGTSLMPVKSKPLVRVLKLVEQVQDVPEFGHCYRKLLVNPDDAVSAEVTWAWMLNAALLETDELAEYSVVKTGPDKWHVTKGLGIPVNLVLGQFREARVLKKADVLIGSYRIKDSDTLGVVSSMTQALVKNVPSLAEVDPDLLDEKGGRVAGLAVALLASEDKINAKVLQAVGDNALSLAISLRILDAGGTVQEYQETRSRVTNNAYLAGKFGSSVFRSAFQDVGPVLSPRTGGGAMECVIGVTYLMGGVEAVEELLKLVGI